MRPRVNASSSRSNWTTYPPGSRCAARQSSSPCSGTLKELEVRHTGMEWWWAMSGPFTNQVATTRIRIVRFVGVPTASLTSSATRWNREGCSGLVVTEGLASGRTVGRDTGSPVTTHGRSPRRCGETAVVGHLAGSHVGAVLTPSRDSRPDHVPVTSRTTNPRRLRARRAARPPDGPPGSTATGARARGRFPREATGRFDPTTRRRVRRRR